MKLKMEDEMPNDSSPKREISPAEENVPPEVMDDSSSSSGSSHSSSETIVSGRSSGHILHRTTKQTNLLEPKVPTSECSRLYLISNTLETVPVNKNSWTNTRRFMAFRHGYICCIPKQLVTNGIIRQTLKFVSTNTLFDLRMKLQLIFRNRIIDEWQFEKGLVYRDVITRWETTINRSPNTDYFDPILTACTVLKTEFYDRDQLLHTYDTCIIFN